MKSIGKSTVKFFYNDVFKVQLPENHRFPMEKYSLVREGLQRHFFQNNQVEFCVSPLATIPELESTHCREYIDRYISGNLNPSEIRAVGFPWSFAGVQRTLSSVGGTVEAMRVVCSKECTYAGHIAGGTHHAFFDYGEGFCVFSDIAVAANLAFREFPFVKKILIIDLDVHQGNGNAVLFQDNENVFTFSMHCKENYFSAKRESNIDIELAAGTGNDEYLSTLGRWLPWLMENIGPDLVFYQAGVDILDSDRLGRLSLTREGVRTRNQMVYKTIAEYGVQTVITMGGGYKSTLLYFKYIYEYS